MYSKYVNDPSVFYSVKKIRNAIIAGLILLAGLKSSEIINMKCIDVDPVDRVIYVRSKKSRIVEIPDDQFWTFMMMYIQSRCGSDMYKKLFDVNERTIRRICREIFNTNISTIRRIIAKEWLRIMDRMEVSRLLGISTKQLHNLIK